jgi:hypothetical protein
VSHGGRAGWSGARAGRAGPRPGPPERAGPVAARPVPGRCRAATATYVAPGRGQCLAESRDRPAPRFLISIFNFNMRATLLVGAVLVEFLTDVYSLPAPSKPVTISPIGSASTRSKWEHKTGGKLPDIEYTPMDQNVLDRNVSK